MMMLSLSLFSLLSFIFFALVEEQEERATIDPLCACSLFSASFFTFLATFLPVTVSALVFFRHREQCLSKGRKKRRAARRMPKGKREKHVRIPNRFWFLFFALFVLASLGTFAPMSPSPWSATASTAISFVAAASLLDETKGVASALGVAVLPVHELIFFAFLSFFLSRSSLSQKNLPPSQPSLSADLRHRDPPWPRPPSLPNGPLPSPLGAR